MFVRLFNRLPSPSRRHGVSRLAAVALALALAVAVGSVVPGYRADAAMRDEGPMLGVFDPMGAVQGHEYLRLEAAYVGWSPNGGTEMAQAIDGIRGRGRVPLLFFDTYPFSWLPGYTDDGLLSDIVKGRYDRQLVAAARQVKAAGGRVYLAWGYGMDECGAHAWSTCWAEGYISAYRRVVKTFRDQGASNVKFVWAPAGEKHSLGFYPGSEYVDMIGLTLLMADEWADWERSRPRPFWEAMKQYYELYWNLNRPFLIVSFGLSTEPQAKLEYLTNVASTLPEYPRVCGLTYANMPMDNAPMGRPVPTFKLSREEFNAFMGAFTPSRAMPRECN